MRQEGNEKSGTLLFLSHEASRTGAPIFLLNLLRWLRQNRDFNFRTLMGGRGDLNADFAAVGTVDSFEPSNALWYKAMRRFHCRNWYDSNHLARLREMFRKEKVALIYANSIASAGMLDFLSFVDCPVICHVHELDGAIREIGIDNLALLERRQPLYLAVSHAVKNSLVENNAIPPGRIQVIHGFIPTTRENAASSETTRKRLREELGLPPAAKVICACGSIDFRKGPDLFLQLARKTIEKVGTETVHFIWVGGTREKVAALNGQLDEALRRAVHFVGHTSDPAAYFDASDVFVLTSREDPFPLVVMEAAERCKPTICFERAGGAPEFVEADAGFVVPNLDVEAMSDRVIELLSSPILGERMGKAARRKVMGRHSLDVGGSKVAAAIEDTLRIHDHWGPQDVTSSQSRAQCTSAFIQGNHDLLLPPRTS